MPPQIRIWSQEDAQQLSALREAAGLDVSVLAKRHSLSIHQVRQLEEGGDDRFYSSAIKLQVGRKLLRALGGDLVEVRQLSEETELADLPSTPIPKPVHASDAVRDATLSVNLQKSASRRWIPFLGLTLLVLAGLGWQQSVFDTSHEKKNPSLLSTAPTPPAAPSKEAVVNDLTESDADSVTDASEGHELLVAADPECPFGQDPLKVSVFEPRRPGDYVYFEAQQPVSLCVRDAAQQITTLDLPAGRGRTIRGAAPFEVLSQHFEGMRIFYQGKLVAPGLLSQTHIVLRPQAIVEQATEVN